MLQMKFLLLILFPFLVYAKGDECINEHNPNLKNLCLAKEYANVTQCEKITFFEMRSNCISIIKHKQRETQWAFKPIDTSTIDTRGDKKYIWER